MRTLYLTRHAKSSWDDPSTDDFHRPLNDRGERDAPVMARVFKERGEPVDRLVSSPAVRAITTARVFAKALGVDASAITQDKGIYLAPAEMLLRTVNLLNDDWQRVMLFGHNPGFTELAEYISDADIGEMATCATVRIDFTVNNWAEVSAGLGTLVWHDYPKRHPELK
jgi:phosphohistidine phosphatase